MSQKPLPKPNWVKNTYFWIAGLLLLLSLVGFVGGEGTIRDPGQKRESGLAVLYVAAAGLMLVNGLISHRQTIQHYSEQEAATDTP
ncbi:MAG: hypothetical protein HY248_05330 [Fimbriimonas ginsengisoli]|uniref:Uncharacterized protein n=1 Tax=Fimbriimonas ginsengisoli TaxID=1005039 RepID=A0A931LRE4_FIMGI|nr:hypothetical protein [Fimbriimonas ginsengisoli]MBI3721957.1 hypothetical protein [Fimbriimonas ginsengisoli]